MEYAGSQFEIKQLHDSGHIEGLLAGFGDIDHGGDNLQAGCLSKSLAKRATPLPMLLHHDMKRPIGAWKEWQERPEGLYVKGSLTLSTRDAQEAHALAKDGALTGLSIGWKPIKGDTDRHGVRTITEAELYEGSLVAVPMHDRARVTAIKQLTGSPADLERGLRELMGLSGRWARDGAFALWRIKHKQDDDTAAEAQAIAILKESAARIAAIGGYK